MLKTSSHCNVIITFIRDAPIPEKGRYSYFFGYFLEGRYRYQLILNLRLGHVKQVPKPVKLDSAYNFYSLLAHGVQSRD